MVCALAAYVFEGSMMAKFVVGMNVSLDGYPNGKWNATHSRSRS